MVAPPSPLSRPYVPPLPWESLSRIFSLGAHTTIPFKGSINFSLTVSHVSRRWREVALSTRDLWTTVVLTRNSPVQLIRTRSWLLRSGSSPLLIYLDFRDDGWNEDERAHRFRRADMEQVLSILLPHLPRWQYLDLHADTWEPIFCFLYHTQKRCAPLLQHVSMARCYTYFSLPGKSFLPQPMKRHFPLFGGGTPKLRRITLTGVHVEWTSMAFRNLTELDLRYHARDVMPTVPEFIRMLSTPQLLQKLAIVGWGTRWCDEMWEGNVVVLPHLLDLHLGFFDPLHASHLLTLMKMNSLTSIVLEEMSRNVDKFIMPTTDATPVLSHFIHYAHRFHGVERMHLRMIHCMPEYFAHFLEVFSSLRDLTLDGVPEPFLNALTSRPHEYGVVCPQLRFVRCRGLSDDAIRNFIRSRANSHHPLRSVNSEVGVSCETSTVCEVIGKTGLSIVPVD